MTKQVREEDKKAEQDEFPILHWFNKYTAEKERADKAEAREKKLREAMEHCIKEYPQWDSKEIAASLMLDYMKNILSILYPLDKEEEAK
ncbi:hypothetical protein ACFQ3W_25540 [Paenibacillus puldeungensis]|uniref:Uncharacterized protein n=1 Tax=Paenibacillus puldeungensis TaxID=696536 RepID=A0ABW3S5L0_9BACL